MNEKQLRAELDAVYASTSWKITAPLRYITRKIISVKNAKFSLRGLIRGTIRYLASIPGIKNMALKVLQYFPAIERRIRKGLQPRSAPLVVSASTPTQTVVKSLNDSRLSTKAQIIFNKLQTDIIRQE